MQYRKYTHIEHLGRDEVDGILNGTVYISPKIDGTNSVLYLDDQGNLAAGSRKRVLTLIDDNAGFAAHAQHEDGVKAYLARHPHYYVYGEWLIKNQINWYQADAWRKFYIFDVYDDNQQRYLKPEEYEQELRDLGATVIQQMAVLTNPTIEQLEELVKTNKYLIDEHVDQIGEGIVLKNYEFINRFGRHCYGKIVASEFLKRKYVPRKIKNDAYEHADVEEKALSLLTNEMLIKEFARLKNEQPNLYAHKPAAFNGMLLQTIWHTFISEEITQINKKLKSPRIDLNILKHLVFDKVRTTFPNQF